MLITASYSSYRGQAKADISIRCPFCDRQSHVLFTGNKIVNAVNEYLSSKAFQQSLPLEVPVREFLAKGTCRECQELYFGKSTNKIKYVKERI